MKNILFTLLFLCTTTLALAQQITVTGVVTDASGEPLVGVSVLEKGTQNGTITGASGDYSINAGQKSVLVFSYVGYQTVESAVKGPKLNITLQEDSEILEDVVVVGYGVQKKSSMTASVASVSAKELGKQITSNVASALVGRTPGVEVLQNGGEAGGDVSIIIRGAGTFGSTEPLYIIDGAVSTNGINSISAADIASIEILKDGSAAAIYGSRAANGVVLVTTKGGKSGKTIVDISGSYSLQTPSKMLDFMNAEQWRKYANMVSDNSPAFERPSQNVSPKNPGISHDWQDLYYQNANQMNLNAGISGGGENSTFSTSVGYTNQEGIVIQSGYTKFNARVNGTYKKNRVTIAENLSLAHSKKDLTPSSRPIMIPTIPVVDEFDRYISQPFTEGYSITNSDINNPLAEIYASDSWNKKTDLTGNLSLTVDLFKGLKYKFNVAGSYLNIHNYKHTPAYASYWDENGTPVSNFSQPYTSLVESRGENFNYTIDNLLLYNNKFGNHTIDAMLGTSWMREFNRNMSINTGVTDLGSPSITTYNGEGTIGSREMNSALLSYFGRVNYDYRNRYLLSLSLRSDTSSKFAKKNRTGWFPSASAGWNMHSEDWFENSVISKMKVRGSWGQLGANFIDSYSFLSLAYGPVPVIFGNKRQFGYVTRLAEQNLKWETSTTYNAAVEMGFFDDALTFTAEYFTKKNTDLLAPLEPLPSSGQTIVINDTDLPYFNTASVRNKGWEFTLGYRNSWNDWTVDVQGNIAFLSNKVLALGEGVQPIRGNLMSSKFNDRPTITKAGLPIGTFWGYKVAGISDEGDFLFEGADGSKKTPAQVTEDDKQVLGNPSPDATYGLNINLGYKKWDMTMFFQGTVGNDIFAAAKYQYYFNPDRNHLTDAMNSWTSSNKNAELPIAKADNYNGGNALPSSFYVEDGSYLRLKNLQVGYTFGKTGFFESARIFVGVQNLFTITDYSLYDPEVSNNTLFDRGIDGLEKLAPQVNARTYNLGFNLTF